MIGRAPRVTVVGDALCDIDWAGTVRRVCPDAPAPVLDHEQDVHRPGGAALAARFAAEAGGAVTLVTALGDDEAGALVHTELVSAGVEVVDLGLAGPTPVKLRIRARGQSIVRVDRGCSPVAAPGPWRHEATAAITGSDAVLVSDYGRGLAAVPALGALLAGLVPDVPVVWDPHVRGPRPPEGLDLLVPNVDEAAHLVGRASAEMDQLALAGDLAARFSCAVAVTLGEVGVVLARPGRAPEHIAGTPVAGDPCGAGDRLAATLAVERGRGAPVEVALRPSVTAARRQVVTGPPAGLTSADAGLPIRATTSTATSTGHHPGRPGVPRAAGERRPTPVGRHARPAPAPEAGDPFARAAAVRAAGGTIVAAGGCFDVLHAGHVRMLEAASALGDCLIVCLNGDLSVRRLKGRHRPVNPVEDRRAVLAGLACVDGVAVFDEDTPCELLELLRPDVFVKGADHAGEEIPERDTLARWGGHVVFVPLVSGRSTTRILQAAAGGDHPSADRGPRPDRR